MPVISSAETGVVVALPQSGVDGFDDCGGKERVCFVHVVVVCESVECIGSLVVVDSFIDVVTIVFIFLIAEHILE
jgi:hypothetical protein